MQLESQLLRGDDFNALTDSIPFQIHLNKPTDLELTKTNRAFTEQLGHPFEEVQELGAELFVERVHPDSLALYPELLARTIQDPSAIFTFVHRLYINGPKPAYSPVITFTKPTKLPNGDLLCLSPLPHNFGSMADKVNQVIEIDDFKLKHFARFQQLRPREIEVLRLLSNGYNNPEISVKLGISRQTVETHRKRLKAKLELTSFRDLMRYALAFGLVTI